jgi:hypothetical protein
MKKNYVKIVLDILMAITFALLMNPRVLDGLPFHEIAGLVIGVAILTHIGLNYKWVINTTKKIFNSNLPTKTRFSYLLNLLLLISMSMIIITGILISRVVFPSLGSGENHGIRGLHNLFSNVTLALVALHVGVHWQWVMSVCKRAFKTKEGKLRKGVMVSIALSVAILAGGIQWFASTATPSKGDFSSKQFEQQAFNRDTPNATDKQNFKFQGSPDGDFHGRDGKFGGHGEHGGGGSGSPFLVMLNYLGIMAVIIIPAYYVEKKLLKNKRKAKKLEPTEI